MRTTLTFVTALVVVTMAAPTAGARPIDSQRDPASLNAAVDVAGC
jgi:hypothetical protein